MIAFQKSDFVLFCRRFVVFPVAVVVDGLVGFISVGGVGPVFHNVYFRAVFSRVAHGGNGVALEPEGGPHAGRGIPVSGELNGSLVKAVCPVQAFLFCGDHSGMMLAVFRIGADA